MRTLSAELTNHILSLLELGYSAHNISSSTGVHHTTIIRLHSKHFPDLHKSSGGHPHKLSPTDIRHATHLIGSGKAENAVQLAKTLQDIKNIPISSQTVRNYLKGTGMKAVVKKKRPLLSKRHQKERLEFAESHQHWTLDDWKRVIWSDETKINCLGSDGRKWVWKKAGEGLSGRLVDGTVKFGGGNLMMWGCMCWEGVGFACRIDGRMDADLYVSIMEDDLQNSLEHWGKTPQDIVFQQDNDPKHTSKKAQTWFQDHDFEVMAWPAQSPDLNPIEHLWHHLKRRLGGYEVPPSGITELWERVEKEWEGIDISICQGLIESMPRRVEAVLKAKGGYTKY